MNQNVDQPDSDLLKQLDDPSTREGAAALIFRRYSEQLLRLVRRNLSDILQRRTEPEDIMQSVFKSLFSRKFELQDSDTLFPLLAAMCVRKTADAVRRNTAERRDVQAEIRHDELLHSHAQRPSSLRLRDRSVETQEENTEVVEWDVSKADDSSIDLAALQLMARGATPEQASIAIEIFGRLPPELQTIMNLRLEGFHDHEIATRLNCTRRTITRRVALLRRHLEAIVND